MIHTVYLYIRDYIFIYVTRSQTSIYWIIGLCSQISFAALRLQLPVCTAIGHVENHGKKKTSEVLQPVVGKRPKIGGNKYCSGNLLISVFHPNHRPTGMTQLTVVSMGLKPLLISGIFLQRSANLSFAESKGYQVPLETAAVGSPLGPLLGR